MTCVDALGISDRHNRIHRLQTNRHLLGSSCSQSRWFQQLTPTCSNSPYQESRLNIKQILPSAIGKRILSSLKYFTTGTLLPIQAISSQTYSYTYPMISCIVFFKSKAVSVDFLSRISRPDSNVNRAVTNEREKQDEKGKSVGSNSQLVKSC